MDSPFKIYGVLVLGMVLLLVGVFLADNEKTRKDEVKPTEPDLLNATEPGLSKPTESSLNISRNIITIGRSAGFEISLIIIGICLIIISVIMHYGYKLKNASRPSVGHNRVSGRGSFELSVRGVPDAGAPVPDAGAPVPDAGAPVPDAGAPVPDAGAPVPQDEAPVPDEEESRF